MKKVLLILLVFMVGSAMSVQQRPEKELLLTCQGNETFSRDNPRPADIFFLREEMESLIKEGNVPIVIESDRDVAWIFLNDPMGCDFPEADFESDYFGIIQNLFPLKINKELRKILRRGNQAFLDALGIEYLVEDGQVFSKIDYEKFGNFMFCKN